MEHTELAEALSSPGITVGDVAELLNPFTWTGTLLDGKRADLVLHALEHQTSAELRIALLAHLGGERFLRFFYSPTGLRPMEVGPVLEAMTVDSWNGVPVRFLVNTLCRYTESLAGRWWVELQVGRIWEPEWPTALTELASYAVGHLPASWWVTGWDGNGEPTDLFTAAARWDGDGEPAGPFTAAAGKLLAPLGEHATRVATVLAADSDEPLPRLIAAAGSLAR